MPLCLSAKAQTVQVTGSQLQSLTGHRPACLISCPYNGRLDVGSGCLILSEHKLRHAPLGACTRLRTNYLPAFATRGQHFTGKQTSTSMLTMLSTASAFMTDRWNLALHGF